MGTSHGRLAWMQPTARAAMATTLPLPPRPLETAIGPATKCWRSIRRRAGAHLAGVARKPGAARGQYNAHLGVQGRRPSSELKPLRRDWEGEGTNRVIPARSVARGRVQIHQENEPVGAFADQLARDWHGRGCVGVLGGWVRVRRWVVACGGGGVGGILSLSLSLPPPPPPSRIVAPARAIQDRHKGVDKGWGNPWPEPISSSRCVEVGLPASKKGAAVCVLARVRAGGASPHTVERVYESQL